MNKKSLWKHPDISNPMYYWLYASSGRIKRTGVVLFGIYLAAIVGLVIKPFRNLSYC